MWCTVNNVVAAAAGIVTYSGTARTRIWATVWVIAGVTLMSLLAVTGRGPYDDEITNFHWVQSSDVHTIINVANSQDVHPPGSYVINRLLYQATGSWEHVKAVGGVLNALGLGLFFWLAYKEVPGRQSALLALMLATASTTVLWGASVRWYAYFDPLFAVLAAVALFADGSRAARTVVLGVGSVCLFYLSYAAFCAIPVLLIIHIARDLRDWKRREVAILIGVGAAALLICLPQLVVFIHVHMHNQDSQTGAPLQAVIQTGMTLLLGNSVFPIAPLPLAFGAIVAWVIALLLWRRQTSSVDRLAIGALFAGLLLMAASGVGIKPRNSVYLLPLVYLLVSAAIAALQSRPRIAATAAVTIYQLLGVWDVVAHENTIKQSYNTDYPGIVARVEGWSTMCARIVTFNHDPVLTYLLERRGMAQSSPYFSAIQPPTIPIRAGDCVAVVRTYHGIIPADRLERAYRAIGQEKWVRLVSLDIDPDRYHAVKAWLSHDSFPSFYVHVDVLKASEPRSLTSWSGLGAP